MALLNFDTTGQQELSSGGSKKIPAGDYTAKIMKSEYVDNSKKTGKLFKFEFEVIGGEHSGTKIPYTVNWENPNATAVEIGRAAMTSIIKACGKVKCGDTNELHGVPLTITVDLVDNEFVGREGNTIKTKRNEIKGFKKLNSTSTSDPSGDAPW